MPAKAGAVSGERESRRSCQLTACRQRISFRSIAAMAAPTAVFCGSVDGLFLEAVGEDRVIGLRAIQVLEHAVSPFGVIDEGVAVVLV